MFNITNIKLHLFSWRLGMVVCSQHGPPINYAVDTLELRERGHSGRTRMKIENIPRARASFKLPLSKAPIFFTLQTCSDLLKGSENAKKCVAGARSTNGAKCSCIKI